MMDATFTPEAAARYAMRVARRMSKDPEALSIANKAGWNAYRTFDSTRGVPWKRWVAACTKRAVWYMWRSQARGRTELRNEVWWEKNAISFDEPSDELRIPTWDWQLLCMYYIDRWPLDVVAKRTNDSIAGVREKLANARRKFLEAYACEQ
jgi:hypothetical protein